MTRVLRFLVVAAFTCLGFARSARAERYACPRANYTVNLAVVFANGVSNHIDDARASQEALRKLVTSGLAYDPYAIAFDVAYNSSEPALVQLWQVAKQRTAMSVSLFVRILDGLVVAPDWFSEAMQRYAAEIDLAAFVDDADLDTQVQTYRDHLRKGRKVIVVAHSQGNLYANAAYRRLFETALPTPGKEDFGIVAVATPAPSVPGPAPDGCSLLGCYLTRSDDLIIRAVRVAYPDTLPPNVETNASVPADPLAHAFKEVYLGQPYTRDLVFHEVFSQLDSFEPLEVTIPDAMLTASLEWNSAADLDLHVYENGGREHVYYAFKDGAAGRLDADSSGFGPENYSAPCNRIEPGEYRFAVGYYKGDGPVTARLRVQAGAQTRTFTRVLPGAEGAASRTNPTTLAWLHVARRANREYDLMLLEDE